MADARYPFITPQPPRASQLGNAFARIEARGIYTNNGPEVQRLETDATLALFGARGATLAVANATLGLMLAIRDAADRAGRPMGYALMPALTFAATAQAALWAGLTPLICDIDPDDWSASHAAEDALIAEYGERISVVIPYATFGNAIDLDRYRVLHARHGMGVVVDAASSLGTLDDDGMGHGAGAPFAVVYSMQATKPFAVGEGGLVHSGDIALIDRLRAMANFGFEAPRTATLPGLNAKMSEVTAVIAQAMLARIDEVSQRRAGIEAAYREALGPLLTQRPLGMRRAVGFMSALLPEAVADRRGAIVDALAARGIGTATYFSPHLGQQPLFRDLATIAPTPVADEVARRIVSLPVTGDMTPADARSIAGALIDAAGLSRVAALPATAKPCATTIVGGGSGGLAMLIAAAREGRLRALARAGLTVVERGDRLGAGRIAAYAITSDSTAETFLTALDQPHEPSIAALRDDPRARAIAEYSGALGVPLALTGPFLDAIGERIATIVTACGGRILTGHEVVAAHQQPDGGWRTRVRRLSDGAEELIGSASVVIATGGHQPLDRLSQQRVAGESLIGLAGDRLIQSDELLEIGGLERAAERLAGVRAPRVTVVGGSTSAVASLALLLRSRPGIAFGAGALTLVHREPLRPFYASAEAARAERFADFGPDDICPVSGFVYRLGGFRLEARELVLRQLAVDGRAPDPRVAMIRSDEVPEAARRAIADADLVVAALGYRPHALPLIDLAGRRIPLAADADEPMVDPHSRVRDATGTPIPGLYGIGLAAGFRLTGKLGGEASFVGQSNGLWLWQNDVGSGIVAAVLSAGGAGARSHRRTAAA